MYQNEKEFRRNILENDDSFIVKILCMLDSKRAFTYL